jgi:oligopeptidase B
VPRTLVTTRTDGTDLKISVLSPQSPKALVLFTSDGARPGNDVKDIPNAIRFLDSGIGVAVAHTRAAGTSLDGSVSGSEAVLDLIAAARVLQALGYASPKNLFLRAANSGGWSATTAILVRPELFRGLILESPLLDLENVVTNTDLKYHHHYVEAWGSDPQQLRNLSPLEGSAYFIPLDILLIISLDDEAVPAVGSIEWVRRTLCQHSELRSVRIALDTGSISEDRDLSPLSSRGILSEEVSFILSALQASSM